MRTTAWSGASTNTDEGTMCKTQMVGTNICDCQIQYSCRVYILRLIGGVLMPDKSGNRVHLISGTLPMQYLLLHLIMNSMTNAVQLYPMTHKLGGPFWNIKLGRSDSRTANFTAANTGVIPPPSSNLSNLISTFQAQGLSVKDMVALSGSHIIGKSRCVSFRNRIYNESNIDSTFAKIRQRKCPRTSGSGDTNLAVLDFQSPNCFDNNYYKNLINKRGLLHSDQVLFNGGSTDSLVRTSSQNEKTFDSDFVTAMIKMGNNKPLTGSQGEIRKNCRKVN